MAGRILPIALATVVGVSIGVATFDRELKEQRRKRLQEEYDREVAAAAALAGQSLTPMASSAIPPPSPHQDKKEETKVSAPESTSSWSSMLGLWAWDKNAARTTESMTQKPAPMQDKPNEAMGKP